MTIVVYGHPAPQGSKRHVGNGVLLESSKYVKPWREAVKCAAIAAFTGSPRPIVSGPVAFHAIFTLVRPKKPKAPVPDRTPDLSKLIRSTEDALTEVGAWEDDARIVSTECVKLYVGDPDALPSPGAVITWSPFVRAEACLLDADRLFYFADDRKSY